MFVDFMKDLFFNLKWNWNCSSDGIGILKIVCTVLRLEHLTFNQKVGGSNPLNSAKREDSF